MSVDEGVCRESAKSSHCADSAIAPLDLPGRRTEGVVVEYAYPVVDCPFACDDHERGESDSESNQEGNGAGGKWEENNMIYNGSTYYKDTLEYYYELCQQVFEEHGEIPPELREFFELYYDSI